MATSTTIIVPIANDMKVLSPEKNIPAIAIITVMPEIKHRATRGGRRSLEGCRLAAPRPSLVALATDVEERVVDADGETDQENDLRDRLVHGHDVARQGDEAHRRDHCGEREAERDQGTDERPEHEHQDHERDRDRDHPGASELRAEHLVESLARRRRAGFDHRELRVRLLHLFGACGDRVDVGSRLVVAALQG